MTAKILKNSKIELEINRSRSKQKRWFVFIVPIFSALAASFIAFKIFVPNSIQHGGPGNLNGDASVVSLADFMDEGQEDVISSVIEEDEFIDMAEELSLLQDFDEIELLTDEELDG